MSSTLSSVTKVVQAAKQRFNRCSCQIAPNSDASTLSLPEYEYQPLSTPLSTRVFKLLQAPSTDAPIRGTLHEINLEETHKRPYIALSYTWGESRRPHYITCDAGRLAITCSLHAALLKLRKATEPVFVFVDCISINQASDEAALQERGAQVQAMNRTFSLAEMVFVDLGEQCDNSDAVVALLRRLVDVPNETWELAMVDFWHELYTIMPSLGDPIWKDFNSFCNRRWFQRLWIVQEYALAADVIFMVGDCRFTPHVLFEGVQRAVQLNRLCMFKNGLLDTLGTTKKRGNIDITSAASLMHIMDNMDNIDATSRIDAIQAMKHACQNIQDYDMSLGHLVWRTKNFNCTISYDLVYALLGLATNGGHATIPADYTESSDALSTRFSSFLIDDGKVLQLLNYHAALDAGSGASWKVDISVAKRAKSMSGVDRKWLEGYNQVISSFQAGGPSSALMCHRMVAPNLLAVRGSITAKIQDTSVPFPDGAAKAMALWSRVSQMGGLLNNLFLMNVWDKSVLKMVSKRMPDLAEAERADICRRLMIVNGTSAKDYEEFGGPVISDDLAGVMEAYGQVMTLTSTVIGATKLIMGPFENPPSYVGVRGQAQKFFAHQIIHFSSQRMCVTESKALGLVPANTRDVDVIAIFLGCPLPFVLRKKGPYFRLIGHAFLNGVMEGEALDDAGWKEEEIVLR
jgi:hypothetical protein